MKTKKNDLIRIENWSVVAGNKLNPYQAPEMQTYKLRGEVVDHPDFETGTSITTSAILARDGMFVTTENHNYRLGYPSEDYTFWCIQNGKNIWTAVQVSGA